MSLSSLECYTNARVEQTDSLSALSPSLSLHLALSHASGLWLRFYKIGMCLLRLELPLAYVYIPQISLKSWLLVTGNNPPWMRALAHALALFFILLLSRIYKPFVLDGDESNRNSLYYRLMRWLSLSRSLKSHMVFTINFWKLFEGHFLLFYVAGSS